LLLALEERQLELSLGQKEVTLLDLALRRLAAVVRFILCRQLIMVGLALVVLAEDLTVELEPLDKAIMAATERPTVVVVVAVRVVRVVMPAAIMAGITETVLLQQTPLSC
tara:strand:- start:252 stop:581 length:330 start_codon:yes stop_codon:yes gene_type:complete